MSKRTLIVKKQVSKRSLDISKEALVDSLIADMIGIIEQDVVRYQTKAKAGGLDIKESKIIRDHTETLLRIKRDQQASRKNNSLSDLSDEELEEAENAIKSSSRKSPNKV